MALFGQASGPVPPFAPSILNQKGSLYLARPSMGHYIAGRDELMWRAGEGLGWIAAGELRPSIDPGPPPAPAGDAPPAPGGGGTPGEGLLPPRPRSPPPFPP